MENINYNLQTNFLFNIQYRLILLSMIKNNIIIINSACTCVWFVNFECLQHMLVLQQQQKKETPNICLNYAHQQVTMPGITVRSFKFRHIAYQRGEEQGSKSPFSLLSEPISPSSLLFEPKIISSPRSIQFNSPYSQLFFFSLLPTFPPISPSSQLFLGHFSLHPILFLPPHITCD